MPTTDPNAFSAAVDEPSVAFGYASYLRCALDDFPTTAFTLTFRFRSTTGGTLLSYGDAQTAFRPGARAVPMAVVLDTDRLRLTFLSVEAAAQGPLTDGHDHDVAITFAQPESGGKAAIGIYIDNVLAQQQDLALPDVAADQRGRLPESENLFIATEPPKSGVTMTSDALFPGRLRDLRVWTGVLDASEIAANAAAALTGNEPDLYMALPLDLANQDMRTSQALDLTPWQRDADAILVPDMTYCAGVREVFKSFPIANLTVSMWLRCGLDAAGSTVIAYCDQLPDGDPRHATPFLLAIAADGTPTYGKASVDIPVTDGRWHHLAVVVDVAANTDNLYVDGALLSSGARSGSYRQGLGMLLGTDNDSHLFNGQLREVRISNEALTAAQVLAEATLNPAAPDSSLVAYWRLRDDAGPDLSSQHNDLGFVDPPRFFGDPAVPRRTRSEPAALPPGLIAATSELTQSYRVATPFSAGADLAAAMGTGVPTTVFSIDFQGRVRAVTGVPGGPDPWVVPTTDTDLAFPGTATSLTSARIGYGINAPSPTLLYAAGQDNIVRLWQKSGSIVTPWAALPSIPMALATDSFSVRGLKTGYGQNGEVFVVALCHILQQDSQDSQAAFFLFSGNTWARFDGQMQAIVDWMPTYIQAPLAVSPTAGGKGVFVSGTLADGRQGMVAWVQSAPSAQFAPFVAGEYSGLANIASGRGGTGPGGVFVIARHEAALYWIGETEDQPDSATVLKKALVLADQPAGGGAADPAALALVAAGPVSVQQRTLFVLRADGSIYGVESPAQGGDWSRTLTITGPFVRLCDAQGVGGGDPVIEVVAVDANHRLRRAWVNPGDRYHIEDLVVPGDEVVEEIRAYRLHLALYTGSGVSAPATSVKLFADAPMRLEINGQMCALDHGVPWEGQSGADGRLIVTLPTKTLGVPSLSMWAGFMPDGDRIALHPGGAVQTRLAALTADQLIAAKTVSDTGVPGNVVTLAGAIDTAAVTAVVAGINRLMSVSLSHRAASSAGAPLVFHRLNDPHVATYQRAGVAARFPRLDPARADSWQLDFSAGAPVFTSLGQVTRSEPPRPSAWTLGDLLTAIADAGAALEHVAVTVGTAAWAEVRFVLNGVSYYLHHPMELVEDVFHLARAVFHKIGVEAEHLFRWLGHVFVWGEIQRTQQMIEHVFNQMLAFAKALPATVKQNALTGLDHLEENFVAKFDAFTTSMLGRTTTVGDYRRRAGNPPLAVEVVAHRSASLSPFHHGTVHHIGGADVKGGANLNGMQTTMVASIQTLVDQMSAGQTRFQSSPALTSAQAVIEGLIEAPVDVMGFVLSRLMDTIKGIVQFGFTLARDLVEAVYNAIEAAVAALTTMLTTPLAIPFVSALYKHATGEDMSIINLVSMSIAVPATVLYKAMNSANGNAAPFPTDASLAAAKASFTYQTVLRLAGYQAATRDTPAEIVAVLHKIFATTNTALGWIFTVFDPMLDVVPPDGIPLVTARGTYHLVGRPLEILSLIAMGMGAVGAAITCPWLDGKPTPPGIANADQIDRMNWIVGWGGPLMDVAFTLVSYDAKRPGQVRAARNASDLSVWLTTVRGAINFGLHTYWVVEDHGEDVLGLFEGYFSQVPVILKCLRYTKWVVSSEGESLAALAVLDLLGDGVAAGLSTVGTHRLFNPLPGVPPPSPL